MTLKVPQLLLLHFRSLISGAYHVVTPNSENVRPNIIVGARCIGNRYKDSPALVRMVRRARYLALTTATLENSVLENRK